MKIKRLLPFLAFITLCVTSCGKVEDIKEEYEDNDEPYEIVYYMPYNDAYPPQDLITVQNKLSQVLRKKINSTIKIIAYTYQEYTSKMSGVIAANSPFDVCFTSPDINPYVTNVQREAFLPLDYLLPTYAPETWRAIPDEIWQQTRIEGKIYGSVNEQIFPRTYGFKATNDVIIKTFLDEKYDGIKPSEVYAHIDDAFDFLEEYLEWIKTKGYGAGGKISAIDTASAMLANFGFDDLGTGMSVPGAVRISDDGYTVVNQFDSPEYKRLIDTVYDWKEKGYIDQGVSSFDLTPDSTWKPGYLSKNMLRLSESHYYTSYVVGTMNAISSTSKNPARAMKFIELLRTDEEVHNILQFGVEDVHYIKDPDNPNRIASFITGSGYDNRNFGWGLGTEFISYLIEGQDDDLWDEVRSINENTPMTKLIGFNFNATESVLKQKISNCKAVINKYITAFEKAQFKDKDSTYQQFMKELKDAGAADVIKAKQEQLDAFLADK